MSAIPILEVISFSIEHPVNKVSNLLKQNGGKWTNPLKNVATLAKGREVTEIEAEFKLPLCKIEAIDVGNFWTANLDLEVGRSGESAGSRLTLLKSSPLLLMTRMDCSNGNNAQSMKFITKSDINPEVLNASKGWDRLRIVCKQHLKNDVLFGLSTLSIRGKRLDDVVIDKHDSEGVKDAFERESDNVTDNDRPDWYVPGSRASRLVESSLKSSKFKFKSTSGDDQVKENRQPAFVSPERKRLREEDDLKSVDKITSSRNQVVIQDVSNASSTSEAPSKFKFKKKDSLEKSSSKVTAQSIKKPDSRNQVVIQDVSNASTSEVSSKFKKKDSLEKSSSKVTITKPDDFLKYDELQLEQSGMLVQSRFYKKPRELPLLDGSGLPVKPGQKVTFIKQGKLILIIYDGRTYEPLVEPEHVPAIFKDYSETDIIENNLKPTPKFIDMKCPLCNKNFGQNEEKLVRHAANCNGMEELVQDVCPICEREYPPELLPEHAQQCAQQMYD